MWKHLAITVVACCLVCPSAWAAAAPAGWTVVFDLTKHEKTDSANRIYSFSDSNTELSKAKALLSTDPKSALDGFRNNIAALPSSDRWIATKGSVLDIWLLTSTDVSLISTVQVSEESRKTQISTDLSSLLKGFTPAAAVPLGVFAHETKYILAKTRANVTVSVAGTADATIAPDTLKAQLITGPTEHLYLSADWSAKSINQLKYDSSTKQLVPKDNPSAFFIGLDYKIGDVFEDYSASDFWKMIVFKGLLQASKTPFDAYGVAVGLRVGDLGFWGFSLDAFSPFAGYIWSKQDKLTSAGAPQLGGARSHKFVAGLSFNLDTGLGWLKGK
jgi:hypothetical protein